ncbi:MAG: DUF6464 family protein [Cyanobacteria bacterium P01_F01_bin.86]
MAQSWKMTRKDYRNEQLILHNFSYGELAYADFSNATLFCCDFRGAHLYRANFANAVLVTCDFSDACLTAADFRVRSHRTCSFGNTRVDGVIWPPETNLIGKMDCRHNARSPFLRCAINPLGPCEDCHDFEPMELIS